MRGQETNCFAVFWTLYSLSFMVVITGLEPARITPLVSQTNAVTSFAIRPKILQGVLLRQRTIQSYHFGGSVLLSTVRRYPIYTSIPHSDTYKSPHSYLQNTCRRRRPALRFSHYRIAASKLTFLVNWCGWRESNPHALRHMHLKHACIAISPHPQKWSSRRGSNPFPIHYQ